VSQEKKFSTSGPPDLENQTVSPEAEEEQTDKPSYTPASPTKRVLAWTGVVYMVLLVLLNFYAVATGSMLNGITGIMLAPACGALAANTWILYQKGKYRGSKAGALFVVILAAFACVGNLVWGVIALCRALGF
jgi:cation transport ATPase